VLLSPREREIDGERVCKMKENGILKRDKEDCEERKKNIELLFMYHVDIRFYNKSCQIDHVDLHQKLKVWVF